VFAHIAEACRQATSAGGFCARVSDDQLAVLVPLAQSTSALRLAKTICTALEAIALPAGRLVTLTRAESLTPSRSKPEAPLALLDELCESRDKGSPLAALEAQAELQADFAHWDEPTREHYIGYDDTVIVRH
jgi:GGDEF domain-containing protein